MGFKCGIVGLPNVGKSTLFNALTKTSLAQVANYPFCTIEPNIGEISVPDFRIEKIASIVHSEKIIPTKIQFVDIAGLIHGSSKGEGLGNKFLSNIREVDAIIHVVRCFKDEKVIHVSGDINPISDIESIELELMISDINSLERRLERINHSSKIKQREYSTIIPIMELTLNHIRKGKLGRLLYNVLSKEECSLLKNLNLLTTKPILYVCNVSENSISIGNHYTKEVKEKFSTKETKVIVIGALIETEISKFPSQEEKNEYLLSIGIQTPGINKLIQSGYDLLNLITYFTCGPKETHAWTIPNGTTAQKAARIIHSDFERGFIRAQIISYDDYAELGGENSAKIHGKVRDEGKNYLIKDGDIVHFKYNI